MMKVAIIRQMRSTVRPAFRAVRMRASLKAEMGRWVSVPVEGFP